MSESNAWNMPWKAYNGMEAQRNNSVAMIGYMCGVLHWHPSAVWGVIGNVSGESTLNPCLWEGKVDPYDASKGGGFGLVQWTGFGKLTIWAHDRGLPIYSPYTQMDRMQYECDNDIQWQYSGHPNAAAEGVPRGLTFPQYITANNGQWDEQYCAKVFYWYYEKSSAFTAGSRPTLATSFKNWYTDTYVAGGGHTYTYYPWIRYPDPPYYDGTGANLIYVLGRPKRIVTKKGVITR